MLLVAPWHQLYSVFLSKHPELLITLHKVVLFQALAIWEAENLDERMGMLRVPVPFALLSGLVLHPSVFTKEEALAAPRRGGML